MDELWNETVGNFSSEEKLSFEKGEESVDLYIDTDILYDLIMVLFEDAGGEKFEAPESPDEIPNYSSVIYLFYAKSPEKVFAKALSILKKRLKKKRRSIQ